MDPAIAEAAVASEAGTLTNEARAEPIEAVPAPADTKPKPKSTAEKAGLVDEAKNARQAHLAATVRVLTLREDLRLAVLEEARHLELRKSAARTLEKEIEEGQ